MYFGFLPLTGAKGHEAVLLCNGEKAQPSNVLVTAMMARLGCFFFQNPVIKLAGGEA